MITTAAVVHDPHGPFVFEEVELDEPRADEVLVRVVATGLCHTDLSVKEQLPPEMFPRVFGHEGTGVVEAVGPDVVGIEVGDHVVVSFRSCRACAACAEGAVGYCEQTLMLNYMGFRMDGSTTHHRDGAPLYGSFFGQSSMARHAIAYADNCVVVDRDLDLTLLAPFACGFQTGAGTVLNLMRPDAGSSLVVFGAGAVGLAAIAAAAAAGCPTIVAVDLMESRLEAAARYGAIGVDPTTLGDQPVAERVKELTAGGASFAIDTTAVPQVVTQAQLSLRVRGTLVALGLGPAEYTIDAIDLLQNGKIIRSSIEGEADPQTFIPHLLDLRAQGRFDVDHLVTTYPFTELDTAIADVLAGRVVKPVLVW
ncbi:NAD(P)-dependent alcohol dehydrogenase [Nocardioides sp.]|uniref:NAD(P)-dependent alcohol dehydrogenase n=1 Tax=Nocardioides sp. TaxID=35761 RepID=UPI0035113521